MDQNPSNVTITEVDEKPRTLFVGNIPADASKYDIESIFGEIGPLKRCHFQYPRNFHRSQPEPIVGYVTFALPEDAATAASKKAGYSLRNNKLSVKLSKTRSVEERQRAPRAPRFGFGIQQPEVAKPKQPRTKSIKKKSRLIIRNLSFQVTEEKLKAHFNAYGDIKDINILKKPNGKLVGCAFIQYAKVSQAAKALRDLNLKPFLDRPIAIDWALPKSKFQDEDDVKDEPKDEKPDVDDLEVTIKEEPLDSDEEKPLLRRGENTKLSTKKKKRREHGSDSESSSSEEEDNDVKQENPKDEEKKPRPLNPNDADEGKTLFIRNLNFDTTSEKVKEFFQQFGPVNYAVICKDRLTEHSKGTAFMKFWSEDTMTKCMEKYEEDPTHFVLDDRQFYMSEAMSKSKLSEKLAPTTIQKEPKDKRNLYLVREGFIRPGTTAADGVSAADVTLRATLHHHKRQMLKDLNNFISDTRLCIHNLPEKYSDKQLRTLVQKHGGPGAKVTEARIMRDKKVVTPDGFKSKGFGFVTFTDHQHALATLRALNNNPQTFSRNRRPVVEFSLEKRAALKAKEKRMDRSREKLKEINAEKQEAVGKKGGKRKPKITDEKETSSHKKPRKSVENDEEAVPDYGGLASQAGLSTIPSLKPKGARKSMKASKPKVKKLLPRRKREKKSQPVKEKGGDDHFEKQLSAYKKKNYSDAGSKSTKKTKWYA